MHVPVCDWNLELKYWLNLFYELGLNVTSQYNLNQMFHLDMVLIMKLY